VLGLSRREIDRKLDEIIDFAEIEEFIDSPVQSYSSGMQVRLGFAVATAIEPDILLLDEVLAVGDANFQAKCYQRIGYALEKAAVILVSHYPYHIQKVCDETILLEHGHIKAMGPPAEILPIYADGVADGANVGVEKTHTILDDTISGAKVVNATKKLAYAGKLELTLIFDSLEPVQCDQAYLNIIDAAGNVHAQVIMEGLVRAFEKKHNTVRIITGPLYISRGRYRVSIILLTAGGKKTLIQLRNCTQFEADGPMRLGAASYFPPSQIEVL